MVCRDTLHTDGFSVAGFMATISVAALWQIAYAPYVSDYTRYMPKDTGVRAAFWATYARCVIGSTLPMLLGALVGAALPNDDTIAGMGSRKKREESGQRLPSSGWGSATV